MNRRMVAMVATILMAVLAIASCSAAPPATPTGPATATSSQAPASPAAGSFRYELHGAVERTVDGGYLSENSNLYEHVLLFVEKYAQSDMTLYFPLDLKTGTHSIDAFELIIKEGRISASSTQADGTIFYANAGGSLVVDEIKDGKISGAFDLSGTDNKDSTHTVTIRGAFREIPLPSVP
jgi:hypothetical protein